MVKNLPAPSGVVGLILGWEHPLEEEMASPLQYPVKNPMDMGAWQAAVTVHSVAKRWAPLGMLAPTTLILNHCILGFDLCVFFIMIYSHTFVYYGVMFICRVLLFFIFFYQNQIYFF